jgi:hypothetical protein
MVTSSFLWCSTYDGESSSDAVLRGRAVPSIHLSTIITEYLLAEVLANPILHIIPLANGYRQGGGCSE